MRILRPAQPIQRSHRVSQPPTMRRQRARREDVLQERSPSTALALDARMRNVTFDGQLEINRSQHQFSVRILLTAFQRLAREGGSPHCSLQSRSAHVRVEGMQRIGPGRGGAGDERDATISDWHGSHQPKSVLCLQQRDMA